MGGVIGDGGIDVDGIDLGISEEIGVVCVALFNAVFVADLVELGFGALADGGQFSVRVTLVDRDEFSTKAEADDCDIWFGYGHDLEGDRFSILTERGEHFRHIVALPQGDKRVTNG